MRIGGEKSLLSLGSRLPGWIQPSPSRALQRRTPGASPLNPFPAVLAHADSQSDSETLAVAGEVLDLTARDREHPPPEGAAELSQAAVDPPVEEAKAEAASPGKGEEKGAEEKQELEKERGVEVSAGDSEGPEEDTASNRSLDLDFASKLMDFKLAEGEAGPGGSQGSAQLDQKHACDTCGKSFKSPGTLSRHRRAHGHHEPRDEEEPQPWEGEGAGRAAERPPSVPAPEPEEKPTETPVVEPAPGTREASVEKQNEETEGPSDGEGTAEKRSSEKSDDDRKPKTDSPKSVASKADKRKKVCSVCNKRFWSLQDLTRHMRSHTGKEGTRARATKGRRGGPTSPPQQWCSRCPRPLGERRRCRKPGGSHEARRD